eukprot:scaffold139_cov325-Pavlova_lutheri.AAC.7
MAFITRSFSRAAVLLRNCFGHSSSAARHADSELSPTLSHSTPSKSSANTVFGRVAFAWVLALAFSIAIPERATHVRMADIHVLHTGECGPHDPKPCPSVVGRIRPADHHAPGRGRGWRREPHPPRQDEATWQAKGERRRRERSHTTGRNAQVSARIRA